MKNISKSSYTAYKNCPKSLWLSLNKSQYYVEDPRAASNIRNGIEVGGYAKKYFSNTVDVTAKHPDDTPDIAAMIVKTQDALKQKDATIAEASFSVGNLFCSVDLLHPVQGGYEIVEVKATTSVKPEHYPDAAFQTYVLKKAGLPIVGTYIMTLNSDYRRHGPLELDKLFRLNRLDTDPKFIDALSEVDTDIAKVQALLTATNEPAEPLASRCRDCPFAGYCHKDLPHPSVLDVNGLHAYKCLSNGVVTYQDLLKSGTKLNHRQRVQVEMELAGCDEQIDKPALKQFVSRLHYPLYYLDFESIMPPIPPVDDSWPYEQIPTQYSLHIEQTDGTLQHRELLGHTMDPRREIAEKLCNDIQEEGSVIVFNKTFESDRLNELAELFPDLSAKLRDIDSRIVDLIEPFKKGDYYHVKMGGSNSIKEVLPALCGTPAELDYHALPLVHNGGEAMEIYPVMVATSDLKEKQKIRDGLLQYCYLDTLAMVEVLKKVKERAK